MMENLKNLKQEDLLLIIEQLSKEKNSSGGNVIKMFDSKDVATDDFKYELDNSDLQMILDQVDNKLLHRKLKASVESSVIETSKAVMTISNVYVDTFKDVLSIDKNNLMTYLRNEHGVMEQFIHSKIIDFVTLVRATLIPNKIVTKQLIDEVVRTFTTGIKTEVKRKIIQFNDYYIDGTARNGEIKFVKGVCSGIPEHYIPRFARGVIEDNKIEHKSEEMDDLLLHISNGDEEVMEYLLYTLSTMFINTSEMKKKYATTIVNFYGEQGQNGKSTLCELIEKVLNKDDESNNFVMTGIDEWSDKNELLRVAKSMVVADLDANSDVLDNKNTSIIKKVASGDSINVKQLYVDQFSMRPSTLILVCSNSNVRSFEKSGGWNRRIEKFEIKEKLNRDGKWFLELHSEESLNYFFELLLYYFKDLISNDEIPNKPQAILDTKSEYIYSENNVLQFLDVANKSDITNVSTNIAYRVYTDWCFKEMLKPLARNTFTSTVTNSTNLFNKTIRCTVIASDSFEERRDDKGRLETVSTSMYETSEGILVVGPHKEIGGKARFTCFMEGE